MALKFFNVIILRGYINLTEMLNETQWLLVCGFGVYFCMYNKTVAKDNLK